MIRALYIRDKAGSQQRRTCGHLVELNVFGCITESGLSALKNGLPDTQVNESVFNYIAKPTVPPAVTSIWGKRTKDFY
ncbi:hypothetical protein KIN20_031017 [Parelaphostrongylus tenuis]|uniref:Uncharacterized protein n=1 Tax=Parelaphostrongylus tenuis TaxID=148309 RepID=A0AAD5WHA9_PARTN|nr:hypothetical protein KIN20_031017 [Parelaphostrongylus tenuis]